METPVLTREQVERASRREGYEQHPVIQVIDIYAPTIIQINQRYSGPRDNESLLRHVRENFGSLANAIERKGDFTLSPLDMIAIWSRATEDELLPHYQRYALGTMVSSAYGIRGTPNPGAWRGFPHYLLENRKVPDAAANDRKGLIHVRRRLGDIDRSLSDIDLYVYGRRDGMDAAVALAEKIRDGDISAKTELDQIIAYQKEHSTPLLALLGEEFGNGLGGVYARIDEVLGFPDPKQLETL